MKQLIKLFPAILVLVIGIMSTILIYSIYKIKILNERENHISTVIEKNYNILENELVRTFSAIQILQLIVEQQEIITEADFKKYSIPLLDIYQNIKALSWVSKIEDGDRANFEIEIGKRSKFNNSVNQLDNESNFISRSKNSFYFPVTYIEPFNENFKALGFDIYSDNLRKETIDLAVKNGKMMITPKIVLVQDSTNFGFLGLSPVYKTSENKKNIENVKGLISAVFKVENLINEVVSKTNNQNISLVVFDITNGRDYFFGNKVLINTDSNLLKKKRLIVGGRTLEFNFVVNPLFYEISNLKYYLIGGILISFLLSLLLLFPIIKERKLRAISASLYNEKQIRTQTQKSLKESEELLRLSTELANVAAWEMDLVNNSMTRSTNHDNLYGLKDVGTGHINTFFDATHLDDREKSNRIINQAIAIGGSDEYKFDFRILYPDKSVHWLNVIGKVIERDSNGVGTKVRGFLTDITDRKQAEEALIKSEEEFRTLAESMPQIVWVTNADGYNIYFNQQWAVYTGLSLEESYGEGWNKPFHPDDQQRAWDAWQNAVNNNGVYSIEARLRRFDGVYKWWLVRGVPIINEKGEIVKWYGTCTDINSYKQISEEIKKLNENLEQRVIERTTQLDALNKELQTFTYSVSHDLKAPLRGIDGYSNLLQEGYSSELNEEAQYFISSIRKNTSQMNKLIEDLLDYSRLERATVRIERIKIKTLLETLKTQFETEISSIKCTFKINVPDIEIVGDSRGLTIALRNIIDNAIKFSNKSKNPKVDVSFENKPKSWLIEVKDNGIGFDMKYKERIFEIFQQLNLPEEFRGTGIGLAMVYKSMEKMGGKVKVESQLGNGAIFYLEIPKQ